MQILKYINMGVAFLAEMALLVALFYGGLHGLKLSGAWRWVAAIALPTLVILAWGRWAAPMSATRLHQPWLFIFQGTMFAIASILLYRTGKVTPAIILAVCAYGSTILGIIWKQ